MDKGGRSVRLGNGMKAMQLKSSGESHPLSLEGLKANAERHSQIAASLLESNPALGPVTALIMAGDLAHAERIDGMFQRGEMSFHHASRMMGSYARFDWVVRQLDAKAIKGNNILDSYVKGGLGFRDNNAARLELLTMRQTQKGESSYFFVDESGDPVFYDAKGNLIVGQLGCSKLLIIGFLETSDPVSMRRGVLDLQKQICSDPYFKNIPSLAKTAIAFHATDDAPEIRYLFYKRIMEFNFKAQFIVARKIEKVFRNDFKANENKFYDHLVGKAFHDVLHRYENNTITFAVRGSRNRQQPLATAIMRAKQSFDDQHERLETTNVTVQPQSPKGEPCLSVIDYVTWALQRAYTKREMRYYEYIEDKVSFIRDLYDSPNYPNNRYYHKTRERHAGGARRRRENLFHIDKTTPL